MEEYLRNRAEFSGDHDQKALDAALSEIEFAVVNAIVHVTTTQDPDEVEDYDDWLWEDDGFYTNEEEINESVDLFHEEEE